MIQGFIFDMDGTMVDNMMIHHRAWQIKLAELGLMLSLEEVMYHCHGVNEETIARLFGDNRFSLEERTKISDEKEAHYRKVFEKDLKLIDGLDDFFLKTREKNILMGVGTAANQANVDFVLDTLNIRNLFKSVYHSGKVTKGKPDPEVFQKVAEEMGVEIEKCIVFEDSPTGAETARRAGCPTIIVTTTHKAQEFEKFPNVIRFIDDFRGLDLEEILKVV